MPSKTKLMPSPTYAPNTLSPLFFPPAPIALAIFAMQASIALMHLTGAAFATALARCRHTKRRGSDWCKMWLGLFSCFISEALRAIALLQSRTEHASEHLSIGISNALFQES